MKRSTKLIAGVAALAALTGAFAFAGCGEEAKEVTGEAYGLAHTGGYVAGATVTVKGEEVTAITLEECVVPSYSTVAIATAKSTESAEAAKAGIETTVAADDYVVAVTEATKDDVTTYTATAYYKTVKFGNITLTYNADNGYVDASGTTFLKLMETEANAKAYVTAVLENKVSVTLGGKDDATKLTKATLCKSENGYWSGSAGASSKLEGDSKWVANRDATIKYAMEHGVESLLNLAKNDAGYWADGSVVSGATWSDLNSNPTGYYSYAQLINNAYKNAKNA